MAGVQRQKRKSQRHTLTPVTSIQGDSSLILRKPLIERKRRERINSCLEQLKETVIRAFHLDSKLEKADILEMTVRYLENIQKTRTTGETSQIVDSQLRFSTGYIQCMHELHNLLLNCDWMDQALGARLLNHLLKSLPKAMDAKSELPFMNEEGAGRTPSPILKPEAGTKLQANILQKHCPLMGSLQMWRPW
ncbi:transcription cofactor HES-6-like isoform X2 [Phyllobates terribilis]|uniref:transcription cofactor HES-6-like isoform X2 n=1 Tax=Phyllobates terribilis TaxID=111132 RepID=UPI003CCB5411